MLFLEYFLNFPLIQEAHIALKKILSKVRLVCHKFVTQISESVPLEEVARSS